MLSALYAIARLSVHLFRRVDHTKTVCWDYETFTIVFAGEVSSRNSKEFLPSGGIKQGRGW